MEIHSQKDLGNYCCRKTHDLPEDLILDIFKRLPVKPLLRLKCLSKTWYQLLVSPAFTTLHLNYHNNMNNQHHHSSAFVHSCSNDHENHNSVSLISKDTVIHIPLPVAHPQCIEIVGSSNGLYCVRVSPRCFIIWNPTTRQLYRNVPKLPLKFRSRKKTHFGFSFLPNTGDYKLVSIVFDHDDENETGVASVKFFTLGGGGANSWREKRIEIVGPRNIDMTAKSKCVLANGCLYWDESMYATTLLSFDMGEEKFRQLGLPHDYVPAGKFTSTAALTVVNGSLALIADRGRGNLGRYYHLYIMNSDHREFSWAKHSTIIGLVLVDTGVPLNLYGHCQLIFWASDTDYPLRKCSLNDCHLSGLKTYINHVLHCTYAHFSPYVESLVNPDVQEKSLQ